MKIKHSLWSYLVVFLVALNVAVGVSSIDPHFDVSVALKKVYRNEGTTFSTDRHDSGNWSSGKVGVGKFVGSKFGIAGSIYSAYFAKRGKAIKDITIDDAAQIYANEYAKPLHLEAIKSQWLGTMFLDTAINCGVPTAAILMTRTINVLNGDGEDFPVDPVITMNEVNAINDLTTTRWYQNEKDKTRRALFGAVFKEMRARRYVQIVRHDPNKLRYLPTWLERTYD